MRKSEFLSALKASLTGCIPSDRIQSHIDYYNDYIDSEIRMEKTEDEVIKGLGDPRLIAKTIINTQPNYKDVNQNANKSSHESRKKGFNMDANEDGGYDYKYGRFKINSWYSKLIGLIIAVLFIIIVFVVIGGLAAILIKMALPILIIVLIVSLFKRNT